MAACAKPQNQPPKIPKKTGDISTVIGDDLGDFGHPPLWPGSDSWGNIRSLFVFISIIFWVFLVQGIIQGQIIDAFALMRNKRDADAADLENKCFVSSIERFVFNRYPGEWEKRQGGRYAWKYLLFFLYLLDKDAEEVGFYRILLYKLASILRKSSSSLSALRCRSPSVNTRSPPPSLGVWNSATRNRTKLPAPPYKTLEKSRL